MARSPLRSHPPAWYPDPQDPRRIRRWDGRAWTGDVRPLPDWLRTVQLSVGPGSARHRLPLGARRLWLVSAAILSLGAALMVLLANGRADHPDRLHDDRFAKAANRRCTEAADEVAALRSSVSGIDVADRVARADGVSSVWATAAEDLRDRPVAGADREKVERWLSTWDRWTTLGHDYAEAIDDRDEVEAEAIVAAAEGERAALARFALVNAMPACAP
jgi:hypothetical protein